MNAESPFFSHVRLSGVELRVHDLAATRRFYEEAIGLKLIQGNPERVELSFTAQSPALIVLVESPDAEPRLRDSAGLFHVAFLYPDRETLGRSARRLVDLKIPFGGGDHGVSEALYLSDPEGNGIELYADRPVSAWPVQGEDVGMYTETVDIASLLKDADRASAPSTIPFPFIGHIHLSVADLAGTEHLFAQALGFPVRQRNFPGALFFGRDGYHHHFGANTWRSRRPAQKGSLGLERFTIELAGDAGIQDLPATLQRLRLHADLTDGDSVEFHTADGIGIRIARLSGAG